MSRKVIAVACSLLMGACAPHKHPSPTTSLDSSGRSSASGDDTAARIDAQSPAGPAFTWCTFSPAIADLKDVLVTASHTYVLEANKVTRWLMADVTDAKCAPTLDTSFGTQGIIEMDKRYETVSQLGDVHLLLSSGVGALVVDNGGSKTIRCAPSHAVVADDGKTIVGVDWDKDEQRLFRGSFDGSKCEVAAIGPALDISTVRTVATDDDRVLVAAVVSRAPGEVVMAYDSRGLEAFRIGAPESGGKGYISLAAHVLPCAGNICVVDAKGDGVTVWSRAGSFVAKVRIEAQVFNELGGASRGGDTVGNAIYLGVLNKQAMVRINHWSHRVSNAQMSNRQMRSGGTR